MSGIGRALTLLAVFGASACAGARTNGDPFRSSVEPASLEVVNNNFNDATIYAIFRADRVRLGTVTGKTTSTFRLPAKHVFEPVYVEIDMVGGVRCVTDTLTLDAGDVMELRIAVDVTVMAECTSGF